MGVPAAVVVGDALVRVMEAVLGHFLLRHRKLLVRLHRIRGRHTPISQDGCLLCRSVWAAWEREYPMLRSE